MSNKFLGKTFIWMFFGLLLSFVTGVYLSTQPALIEKIFSGPGYLIVILLELFLVIFLSARVAKMSQTTAMICYALYAIVSGVTFCSIFLIFEVGSIIMIFAITAVIFLIFGVIGYLTNIDLSKFGVYLMMALVGIILASLVNFFLKNDTFDMILCAIGVLVFVFYTAYDVQKIKKVSNMVQNTEKETNFAIVMALEIYLDFVNLFLYLIRLFGKERN